jgi:hypothetical protein
MNPEPNRPAEHRQVIALLKEAQAPPADAETPAIPDELLDRLRGQYGRTPRRAVAEEKPGLWAWLCEWFYQPKFAFAVALVTVCGVTTAVLLRPPDPEVELLRGGEPHQAIAPAYWLQSDQAEPAPSGLGMPKFVVITARDPLPAKGDVLIFDPARREVRAVNGGSITAKVLIDDPTDANEWLGAHRQLRKLSAP